MHIYSRDFLQITTWCEAYDHAELLFQKMSPECEDVKRYGVQTSENTFHRLWIGCRCWKCNDGGSEIPCLRNRWGWKQRQWVANVLFQSHYIPIWSDFAVTQTTAKSRSRSHLIVIENDPVVAPDLDWHWSRLKCPCDTGIIYLFWIKRSVAWFSTVSGILCALFSVLSYVLRFCLLKNQLANVLHSACLFLSMALSLGEPRCNAFYTLGSQISLTSVWHGAKCLTTICFWNEGYGWWNIHVVLTLTCLVATRFAHVTEEK